jgi:hypothetical protein
MLLFRNTSITIFPLKNYLSLYNLHIIGGSRGGGYVSSGRSTSTSVILGVIIPTVVLCASFCVYYCCRQCYRGKPFQSNSKYVNKGAKKNSEMESLDINLFQSGLWTGQYFQANEWHTYQLSLVFNKQALTVSGSGTDDVGTFSIDGIYSINSRRIAFTKKYERDTENPSENFGHTVTVQAKWNSTEGQFEGKWYVEVNKYRAKNKFQLSYNKQQSPSINNNVEEHVSLL